jgi:hypothetical protein
VSSSAFDSVYSVTLDSTSESTESSSLATTGEHEEQSSSVSLTTESSITTSQTTVPDQLISDVTSEETSLGTITTNIFTVSTEPAHFTFSTDDPATVITLSTDVSSHFSTMPFTTEPTYTTEAVTTPQNSESTYSTLPSTVNFNTPQSMFSSIT